jgi:transcription initiation factor TFIIF subunit beta
LDERGVPEKRERLEKSRLLELIFAYFRKKNYWALKELNEYTRQPEAYLKEVLKEVCIYHTTGPYKGLYELMPEFQMKLNKSDSLAHSQQQPK